MPTKFHEYRINFHQTTAFHALGGAREPNLHAEPPMTYLNFVKIKETFSEKGPTLGGAISPPGHTRAESLQNIEFPTRPDAYSTFGEF